MAKTKPRGVALERIAETHQFRDRLQATTVPSYHEHQPRSLQRHRPSGANHIPGVARLSSGGPRAQSVRRDAILRLRLREHPGEEFLSAVGVVPTVVPDARIFGVTRIGAGLLERFGHRAVGCDGLFAILVA